MSCPDCPTKHPSPVMYAVVHSIVRSRVWSADVGDTLVDVLDVLWHALTEDEQREAEKLIGQEYL